MWARHERKESVSHPSRGAWIEIYKAARLMGYEVGRTPRGVRGLKSQVVEAGPYRRMSHPSRGAWIEIQLPAGEYQDCRVAPLAGCVD